MNNLILSRTLLETIPNTLILVVTLVYVLFAYVAYVKVKRLENWLLSLKQYNFPHYFFIHFALAATGWVIGFILLLIFSIL